MDPLTNSQTNPIREYATLEVDGEQYQLCYDFRQFAEAERITGQSLLIGDFNFDGMSMVRLRGLLYAALKSAHPDVTLEVAERMIRFDTASSVMDAIARANELSKPKKKEDAVEGAIAQ